MWLLPSLEIRVTSGLNLWIQGMVVELGDESAVLFSLR